MVQTSVAGGDLAASLLPPTKRTRLGPSAGDSEINGLLLGCVSEPLHALMAVSCTY